MKIPVTRIEMYDVDLTYVTTLQQWRSVWRRLGMPKERPTSAGLTSTYLHAAGGDLAGIVIWLDLKHRQHQTPAGVVNTLAHESWHAVTAILDALAEPRDKWHEQPAYLLGWMTQWLWTNTPEEIR